MPTIALIASLPAHLSGLTYAAEFWAGGALIASVPGVVELTSGSGEYEVTWTGADAGVNYNVKLKTAGRYDWIKEDVTLRPARAVPCDAAGSDLAALDVAELPEASLDTSGLIAGTAEATRALVERDAGPIDQAVDTAAAVQTGVAGVKAKTDLIGTSNADSPRMIQAATDAGAAATNSLTAATAATSVASGVATIVGRLPSSNQLIAGVNDAQGLPPGAGADPLTCTFTLADDTPVADADAWLARNAAGTQIVDSGQTDTDGNVTFLVDGFTSPGVKRTFYFFAQKDGVQSKRAVPVVCN